MQPNNIMGFALDMIQHNPALQNNPNAREMIDVIRSGDRQTGLRACSAADIAGEIECIQPRAKAHGPRTRAVEFAAPGMEFHDIECRRCTGLNRLGCRV